MTSDEEFMSLALLQAQKAFDSGEVPIGAVIVKDEQVIGEGFNQIESSLQVSAHAELIAISEASRSLGNWRLSGCTLYSTVEPCPMCLGAIGLSRLERVVYGASEPRFGATRHVAEILAFTPRPEITAGVLEEKCKSMMQQFFKNLRNKSDNNKA